MIVMPDYRGHRIEIVASRVDGGRFNAVVDIRRTLSDAKPIVETVACVKATAQLAEASAEIWAKSRADLQTVKESK